MKNKSYSLLFLLLVPLLFSGCSFSLVSKFDPQTMESGAKIGKMIDRHYLTMLHMPKEQRTYSRFFDSYLNIKVEIRNFNRLQQMRTLNELTTKQVEILSELWMEDMQNHQKKNTMSDFIIKRRIKQYNQVVISILRGEESKNVK